MDKKVLVMTGASDILFERGIHKSKDNSYYDLLDLTTPSKERYARKHKYDFLCLHSFGTDSVFGFKETEIGFLRSIRVFQNLQTYDVVMWLDADAIVTNEDLSLDLFPLEEDVTFYASYDWMGNSSFSTGNFIIQRTKYIKQFFDLFIQVAKHHNEEQVSLNIMYYQSNAKETMKILDCKFLNSFHEEIMKTRTWAGRQPISPNCHWKSGDFLCHVGGIRNDERIEFFNKHFKEYL